jgi:outer membrane biosynthesis protein TonB
MPQTPKPKPKPKPKVTPKVTTKPSPKPKPKKINPLEEMIALGIKKLPKEQKDKIAKMLGIVVDNRPNRITNPDYKGNPKDLNPNWKPSK